MLSCWFLRIFADFDFALHPIKLDYQRTVWLHCQMELSMSDTTDQKSGHASHVIVFRNLC